MKGVYQHHPQQGFQRGHGLLNGGHTGHKVSPENLEKMRLAHRLALKGKPLTPEHRQKISMALKGNQNQLGKKFTPERCQAISRALKGKPQPWNRGENAWNWKGGYQNKLMNNRMRRVRKLGNGGAHSFEEWEALKDKYNHICLCCKQQEPFITLSEDHIMPLSLGGTDDISNIQPLCRSCNSKKRVSFIDFRESPFAIGMR